MLSFDNIITSRSENDHSELKRALKSFVDDLKKIVTVLEFLLKKKKSKYVLAREEAKTRYSKNCSIVTFNNFHVFISPYALKLMRKQLDKIFKANNISIPLLSCINTYQQSLRLSRAHVIDRKTQEKESLKLENVHSH